MLNELINELRRQIEKESKYIVDFRLKKNLLGLFVLKYYCDIKELSYEELIKQNQVNDISFPIDTFEYKMFTFDNTRLLALIQYENLQDLIKEYLSNSDIGINIIDKDIKKICISSNLDKSLYDSTGNTTYVIDKLDISRYDIESFKFFDKVLEINNKYVKYEELMFDEYNYVYLYDNIPRYRFIKNSDNDVYDVIRKIIYKNDKLRIILHTDYKKIANLKESRFIIKYMSKVLLLEDGNAFVYYEKKEDDKVSIINYDKNKIKSLSRLLEIMENNRKLKDILVKTTVADIEKNYYRIGFRLYQKGIEESIRNINEIADENTNLINKLSDINKSIEQEINKLINR